MDTQRQHQSGAQSAAHERRWRREAAATNAKCVWQAAEQLGSSSSHSLPIPPHWAQDGFRKTAASDRLFSSEALSTRASVSPEVTTTASTPSNSLPPSGLAFARASEPPSPLLTPSVTPVGRDAACEEAAALPAFRIPSSSLSQRSCFGGPCFELLQSGMLLQGASEAGERVAEFWDSSFGTNSGHVRFLVPAGEESELVGRLVCSVDGEEKGAFSEATFSRSRADGPVLTLPELGLSFKLPRHREILSSHLVDLTGAFESYGVAFSSVRRSEQVEAGCQLCGIM